MEHVNPITDADLKRLEELHAEAEKTTSPDDEQSIGLGFIDSFPALRERLRLAEEENERIKGEAGCLREALTKLLADQLINAQEDGADIVLSVKPGRNPCLVEEAFHALESEDDLKWLAGRDAKMKALGAAEVLEDIAKDEGIDGGKCYMATVVYREFPDVLTTKVGVVEGSEIMARAAALRERAR